MRGDFDEDEDPDLEPEWQSYDDGCNTCGGEGVVVVCIDDMCRGIGWCIHGDGMAPCPECARRERGVSLMPNHPSGGEQPSALAVLKSIDATLKQLLQLAQRRATTSTMASVDDGPVASDKDLDGQYGDPEVRAKDPRDWTGPSMKGYRFSECSPDYLDLLADRYDYFERKNTEEGDKEKAKYARLDAARARGWARRLRNGWKPAATSGAFDSRSQAPSGFGFGDPPAFNDDDIPFAMLLPLLIPVLTSMVA